jgi:hypothetical protein
MTTTINAAAVQATTGLPVPPVTIVDLLSAVAYHAELTGADAAEIAELLGIDFAQVPYSVEDLLLGLEIESEIGNECAPSMVDAPDDDLVDLGRVAARHLQEQSDYYTWLAQAHAPGDPTPARYAHADVGTD